MQKAPCNKASRLSNDMATQLTNVYGDITANLGPLSVALKGRAVIILGKTMKFAVTNSSRDALAFMQTLATISQDPVLFQSHLETFPL